MKMVLFVFGLVTIKGRKQVDKLSTLPSEVVLFRTCLSVRHRESDGLSAFPDDGNGVHEVLGGV